MFFLIFKNFYHLLIFIFFWNFKSHDYKYGAKYVQKLSQEEFQIRMNNLEVLTRPYFETKLQTQGYFSWYLGPQNKNRKIFYRS